MGAVRILYEDDHLIAVDKPAGVIVHGDGTGSCTLTENVRDLVERRGGSPEQIAGVQALQRLDRETTGIVLFSLRKETQAAFDRIIAERAIEKRYLAIASGRIRTPREITAPIGRDRHDSRRGRSSLRSTAPPPTNAPPSGRCSRSTCTPGASTRSACTWPTSATPSWEIASMADLALSSSCYMRLNSPSRTLSPESGFA